MTETYLHSLLFLITFKELQTEEFTPPADNSLLVYHSIFSEVKFSFALLKSHFPDIILNC